MMVEEWRSNGDSRLLRAAWGIPEDSVSRGDRWGREGNLYVSGFTGLMKVGREMWVEWRSTIDSRLFKAPWDAPPQVFSPESLLIFFSAEILSMNHVFSWKLRLTMSIATVTVLVLEMFLP